LVPGESRLARRPFDHVARPEPLKGASGEPIRGGLFSQCSAARWRSPRRPSPECFVPSGRAEQTAKLRRGFLVSALKRLGPAPSSYQDFLNRVPSGYSPECRKKLRGIQPKSDGSRLANLDFDGPCPACLAEFEETIRVVARTTWTPGINVRPERISQIGGVGNRVPGQRVSRIFRCSTALPHAFLLLLFIIVSRVVRGVATWGCRPIYVFASHGVCGSPDAIPHDSHRVDSPRLGKVFLPDCPQGTIAGPAGRVPPGPNPVPWRANPPTVPALPSPIPPRFLLGVLWGKCCAVANRNFPVSISCSDSTCKPLSSRGPPCLPLN